MRSARSGGTGKAISVARRVNEETSSNAHPMVGQALGLPIPRALRIRSRCHVGLRWHRLRETSVCRRHRIELFETAIIKLIRSCGFASQTSVMSGPPIVLMARRVSEGTSSNAHPIVGQALGLPIPRASRIRSRCHVGLRWHRLRETSVRRRHRIEPVQFRIDRTDESCGFASQTSQMSGPPGDGTHHALHSLSLVQGRATQSIGTIVSPAANTRQAKSLDYNTGPPAESNSPGMSGLHEPESG